MTFGASAKRARSDAFPVGLRVACLHECIEQFNLFGFQSTRQRLMARFGVSRGGWTPAQINDAVDLLAAARQSWVQFLTEAQQRQRDARAGNRAAPEVTPVRRTPRSVSFGS